MYLFELVFLFLLGIYPAMELLDHMVVAAFGPVWSCDLRQMMLECSLGSGWCVHLGSHRKLVSEKHSFSRPFLPCFRSKQAFMCSSGAESRLAAAFLIVPLVIWPAKGARLPFVELQGCGAQYVAWTTHSPKRIPTSVISLFLWVPSQGHQSWPDCFFSLSTKFCVCLSYSLSCTGVFMLVSS